MMEVIQTTFSTMTLSILGLSETLCRVTLSIKELEYQHSAIMLGVEFINWYAVCRYAECRYAECHGAVINYVS
jgi:hypothetical protein